MKSVKVTKLNESYSEIEADKQTLLDIYNYLKVLRPGAYFEHAVKAGFKSPYHYFGKIENEKLYVLNGHLDMLSQFGINKISETSDFSIEEVHEVYEELLEIMPFKPYDYQVKAFYDNILTYKQISIACTGSGKSAIIFMIVYFLIKKNRKGALIVPNINLLTQLKQDFIDYIKEEHIIDEFLSKIDIQGGGSQSNFDKPLVISTWQSLLNKKEYLDKFEYIITDEAHKYSGPEVSEIISGTINAKMKYGFTGTLPESQIQKMILLGLFGLPKKYISSRELIERGLGTPIKINSIVFKYSQNDKKLFAECGKTYIKQLQFIKEHEERSKFVVNLCTKLKGNTLVLASHINHMKSIFVDIMKIKYPDVEVQNKDISGKKSFEFQEKYGIYYIDGSDDAKTREKTRKILEEHENAILVSGYALLSTGVNIKALHNMVFASPLKAFTTITQSIGRGIRKHHSKSEFLVFDLVDDFGYRKPGGVFYKQYEHRKKSSYNTEEFPIVEKNFNLF